LDEVPGPEAFLSGKEMEKLASYKFEKRRRDWLGGRYAAKLLIKETLVPDTALSKIEITYDPLGRPVWQNGERPRLISITHSGPFCAAACAGENAVFLGIDLEKAEPRAGAWYQDYFHKNELAGHRGSETAGKLGNWTAGNSGLPAVQPPCALATRLWTQKEALLKALGLGLKADPLDINLAGETPEFLRAAAARYEELGRPPFFLRTLEHGPDYSLSLVWQRQAGE
jgi:4'-phosphopantetheinyl transferase